MFNLLILPAVFAEPSIKSAAIILANKAVGALSKDDLDNVRVYFFAKGNIRVGFKMSHVFSDEFKIAFEKFGFDKKKGTKIFTHGFRRSCQKIWKNEGSSIQNWNDMVEGIFLT